MISFPVAQKIILAAARATKVISLPLEKSLGFFLAETIHAREAIPMFDMSAVDGFAVRVDEIQSANANAPIAMKLQSTTAAGDAPASLKKNCAIKIFTGGAAPRGANAIVMKEFTREENGVVIFFQSAKISDGIRRKGGEFKRGAAVLRAGTRITPPVMGLLATLGCAKIQAHAKPRVALVVTGNELRSPAAKLKPGQQRDANSFSLAAALQSMGIAPTKILHARDTRSEVHRAISHAIRSADVVITTGGVSVGELDLVKEIFSSLGVQEKFWRVAMRPGKPNYFGTKNNKLFFGLPGNPVAALLSLQLLVRPALLKMQSAQDAAVATKHAITTVDLKRKSSRTAFLRATLRTDDRGTLLATPTIGQESHMLGGIATADCVIVVHAGEKNILKGERVKIIFLKWN